MGKGKNGACAERVAYHVGTGVDPELLEAEIEAALHHPRLTDHRLVTVSLAGSHAYGLAHADSDLDLRGVYLAPTEQLFDRAVGASPFL